MINREALEDAVYDYYPDLDMSQIEKMETGKLEWLIDIKHGKHVVPGSKPKTETIEVAKVKKPKKICEKISSTYEIRNGELMHVETWRTVDLSGQTTREYLQQPGARVSYDGRMVSASLLKHYLLTGEWVKRVPKPRKAYKAQVRKGHKVVYLGRFATIEERDGAVFAYNLGISNPMDKIF
jgi:hypothetical protein